MTHSGIKIHCKGSILYFLEKRLLWNFILLLTTLIYYFFSSRSMKNLGLPDHTHWNVFILRNYPPPSHGQHSQIIFQVTSFHPFLRTPPHSPSPSLHWSFTLDISLHSILLFLIHDTISGSTHISAISLFFLICHISLFSTKIVLKIFLSQSLLIDLVRTQASLSYWSQYYVYSTILTFIFTILLLNTEFIAAKHQFPAVIRLLMSTHMSLSVFTTVHR